MIHILPGLCVKRSNTCIIELETWETLWSAFLLSCHNMMNSIADYVHSFLTLGLRQMIIILVTRSEILKQNVADS